MMFAAVLLERPALSLYNLAIAAAVLIICEPETVLSASFQMSFLAVMGLISAHEATTGSRAGRDREKVRSDHGSAGLRRGSTRSSPC